MTKIEIKFFITTAGYTLFDHKKNEEILEEVKKEPADETLKWIQIKLATICNRMNGNRMAQIMLNYRPDGRRWLVRHLKGLLDQSEADLPRLNWWRMMMIIRVVRYKSRPQNWTILYGTDWTNENCSQPNDNDHNSLSAECDTWPGRRTDSEGEAHYCWHLWEIWSPIRIHVTSSR